MQAVLDSALPIFEAGVTSGSILVSHIFAVLTVSLLVAWLAPG